MSAEEELRQRIAVREGELNRKAKDVWSLSYNETRKLENWAAGERAAISVLKARLRRLERA